MASDGQRLDEFYPWRARIELPGAVGAVWLVESVDE